MLVVAGVLVTSLVVMMMWCLVNGGTLRSWLSAPFRLGGISNIPHNPLS